MAIHVVAPLHVCNFMCFVGANATCNAHTETLKSVCLGSNVPKLKIYLLIRVHVSGIKTAQAENQFINPCPGPVFAQPPLLAIYLLIRVRGYNRL